MTYRIKEIRYHNHTEYWLEKSIRVLGFHLFWDKTTISYYSKREYAEKELEDRLNQHHITVNYYE